MAVLKITTANSAAGMKPKRDEARRETTLVVGLQEFYVSIWLA
jgi:hypothetical protein